MISARQADLRAWTREARALRPVFVVGDMRSGTSIIYRSLQSHPNFLPTSGLNLVESHATALLPDVLGPDDVRPGPLAAFLLGPDGLAAVARDVAGLATRRRLVRRATGRRLGRLPVWKAAGEHHVVRRYFLEAAHRRGAPRLVEKTADNLPWIPHLATAFPQARFVFVVRHPVDVLSSYMRRYRVDPDATWADIPVEVFCARWEANTRRALDLAARDPRFLLVRYEEFTSVTETVVHAMLAHVGEPFAEASLLRTGAKPGRWRPDPHLYATVSDTTKQWQDYLDEATARSVELRLWTTMQLARYGSLLKPARTLAAATG